jgi:hypothetical protein
MEELLVAAGTEESDVSITVDRKDTRISYLSATEAAERLPATDLTDLNTIVLRSSESIRGSLSVGVWFHKVATVLKVEGSGDQHIKVAGIADDLSAEIDRHGRSVPHRAWIIAALAATSAILVVTSNITGGWVAKALAAAALLPVVPWMWLIRVTPFLPAREIVADGERSRAERLRGLALRFTGWAFTLASGAILGALVTKWLD